MSHIELSFGPLVYEGKGMLEFREVKKRVRCKARATVGEFGDCTIDVTFNETNGRFLALRLPSSGPNRLAPYLTLTKVVIETRDGCFVADKGLYERIERDRLANVVRSLRVRPSQSHYEGGASAPEHWIAPIFNFVGDFGAAPKGFARHPLRIKKAKMYGFKWKFGKGFLQQAPNYDTRIGELEKKPNEPVVTAVLVGEMGTGAFNTKESHAPSTIGTSSVRSAPVRGVTHAGSVRNGTVLRTLMNTHNDDYYRWEAATRPLLRNFPGNGQSRATDKHINV